MLPKAELEIGCPLMFGRMPRYPLLKAVSWAESIGVCDARHAFVATVRVHRA